MIVVKSLVFLCCKNIKFAQENGREQEKTLGTSLTILSISLFDNNR